jgi:ubiquinone/menaquinone biosynthesis C-methylase UbiE
MNTDFFVRKQGFFDKWANNYDCLLTTVFYQAIHRRILDYVTLNDNCYILDLGCGTGKLFKRLAKQFPTLSGVGLDLSENMVKQAKLRNQFPERITFKQGNAESLPFQETTFDGVFNTISFLHYRNPQEVFKQVSRVLKKDGYFYLADYTMSDDCNVKPIPFSPGGLKFYSPKKREEFANNAGLICEGHYYLLAGVLLSVFRKIS